MLQNTMLLVVLVAAIEKIQKVALAMAIIQEYVIVGELMEGVFHFLKYCLQMHVSMIVNIVLIVELIM